MWPRKEATVGSLVQAKLHLRPSFVAAGIVVDDDRHSNARPLLDQSTTGRFVRLDCLRKSLHSCLLHLSCQAMLNAEKRLLTNGSPFR